ERLEAAVGGVEQVIFGIAQGARGRGEAVLHQTRDRGNVVGPTLSEGEAQALLSSGPYSLLGGAAPAAAGAVKGKPKIDSAMNHRHSPRRVRPGLLTACLVLATGATGACGEAQPPER